MKSFGYTRPETLEQAVALLSDETRPLAGGTDLIPLMKEYLVTPSQVVDIKRLPELTNSIERDFDAVDLGALVTLADLAKSDVIGETLPALQEAAKLAASPALRNMATLGGNVLQRPRCWYFRNEQVPCWLKGGEKCYAREGENRFHGFSHNTACVAVHASDLAPVLMAYGATIRFVDRQGRGEVSAEDFFQLPDADRRREHVLPNDAVITNIVVPLPASGAKGTYLKAMDRKVWAFAVAGVAAVIECQGGTIADAKIVLGGVGPIPMRAKAAEHVLLGSQVDASLAQEAADAAVAGFEPLRDNAYKIDLLRELVRRAICETTGCSDE